MAGCSDLRTGLWHDQTANIFSSGSQPLSLRRTSHWSSSNLESSHTSNRLVAEHQYTADEQWTLGITSIIAAALTLATPSFARILASFGKWSQRKIEILGRNWRTTGQWSCAEGESGRQHLLENGRPPGYGGTSNHHSAPPTPDNRSDNGDTGRPSSPGTGGQAASVDEHSLPQALSPSQTDSVDSARQQHAPPHHSAGANGHAGGPAHAEPDATSVASAPSKRTRGRTNCDVLALIIAVLGTLGVISMFVVGIFAPRLATETAGIAASRACGQWEYDREASSEERLKDFQRAYLKEDRAAQYAQNCYGLSDARLDNSLACDRFYNENITFIEGDAQCPFKNKTICLESYGAVAYSTELVSATHLGINTGSSDFKFRRNTTCSPITLDGRWTRNGTRYYYYFGGKLDDNIDYTFYTDADVLEWEIPQYSLDVYFYDTVNDGRHNWIPIDDLLPDVDGGSVSLMFISSHHLWHYEQSNDPIFPATSQSPRRRGWYYNGDLKARPLACVDTTEIWAGGKCDFMNSTTLSSDHAWWFMKMSLERSNTYEAIKHRLGFGLLAQQKISGYFTRGLLPEQWKVESRALFATSLSRIQWDAWSIATGEDIGVRGYKDYTADQAKGRICGLYKFSKKGLFNTNVMAFWSIITACLIIAVAALPAPDFISACDESEMLAETVARKVREASCYYYCCGSRRKHR